MTGHDAVESIAAQPWRTGKVGMLGESYEGRVQWAARHPAHLATMLTSRSPGRWSRDWPCRLSSFFAADYPESAQRCSQAGSGRGHPTLCTLRTDTSRPLVVRL